MLSKVTISPIVPWPGDEPLEFGGEAGALLRVDHRVLVGARRFSRVERALVTDQQVDQPRVGASVDRGRAGDHRGEGCGGPGVRRRLFGECHEVGELGGSTGS